MPKPRQLRRPTVLFVDDDPYNDIFSYERAVARKLGLKPRFVRNPEKAVRAINRRMIAIERLR